MFTVKVELKENPYNIVIGKDILKDLGSYVKDLHIGTDAVVITNPIIRKHHGRILARGLRAAGFSVKFIELPSGERSKSAHIAFQVIKTIADYAIKKKVFIVAFGGGVIGDLAGFVAAIYKRGIPYIQVPTTLLAQVDSAIGGKVAVDLPAGKNLIGAFYQPRLVWSDVSVLHTLTRRQIKNGLSETIKYGIIADRYLFDHIEMKAKQLLALESQVLIDVILSCSRIKARVVASDEKETRGIRTILNFGHTLGHAVEAADQYRHYHHGEAVALGMRMAVFISFRMGLIAADAVGRIDKVISDLGLPTHIKDVTTRDILKHMQYDKKFHAKKNRFVLATAIGSVKVLEGIDRRIIRSALKKCMT